MDLQNMKTLLNLVGDGQATAAFNFIDLDDLRGIVCAAEQEETPVILQVSQSTAKHLGLDYAASMARAAARRSRVPLCLHLDHASDIDIISDIYAPLSVRTSAVRLARVDHTGKSHGFYQPDPSPVGFPCGSWRGRTENRTVLHTQASPNATGGGTYLSQTIGNQRTRS